MFKNFLIVMKTQSVFAFIPEFVEFELFDESVSVELVVVSVPILAGAVLDFLTSTNNHPYFDN